MRKKTRVMFFLPLLLVVAGCTTPAKLAEINRYDLYHPTGLKMVTKWDEQLYVYEDKSFTITMALFEYKGLVLMPIEILNKMTEEIKPDSYGVYLFDGRDHLPLKMISREELEVIRQKNISSDGFNPLSPSLQGAFSAFNSLMNYPAQSAINSALQNAIDEYFAFRPIFAHEIRTGFLVFYHDFRLEYPLLLKIRLKDEDLKFYFRPRQNAQQ